MYRRHALSTNDERRLSMANLETARDPAVRIVLTTQPRQSDARDRRLPRWRKGQSTRQMRGSMAGRPGPASTEPISS